MPSPINPPSRLPLPDPVLAGAGDLREGRSRRCCRSARRHKVACHFAGELGQHPAKPVTARAAGRRRPGQPDPGASPVELPNEPGLRRHLVRPQDKTDRVGLTARRPSDVRVVLLTTTWRAVRRVGAGRPRRGRQAARWRATRTPRRRWRCGCGRAPSTSWSARSSCAPRARRCASWSRATSRCRCCCGGRPGTGKTTIAAILSQQTDRRFVEVSAVVGGGQGGAGGDRRGPQRAGPRRPRDGAVRRRGAPLHQGAAGRPAARASRTAG